MQYLLFLLIILNFGCSHRLARSPQSVIEEKIEQISEDLDLVLGQVTEFRFRVIEKIPLKRIVKIEGENHLEISKSVVTTNSGGEFSVLVKLKEFKSAHIILTVPRFNREPLQLKVNFKVHAEPLVVHTIDQIDWERSLISFSAPKIYHNGADFEIKIILNDKDSQPLKALKKLMVRDCPSALEIVKLKKITQNKNELNLNFESLRFAEAEICLNFEDASLNKLNHKIPLMIHPQIDSSLVEIKEIELTDESFLYHLIFKDKFQNIIPVNWIEDLSVQTKQSNFNLERSENHFELSGSFPYGKGSYDFDLYLNGKILPIKKRLPYFRRELDTERSQFSIVKPEVAPYGIKFWGEHYEANFLKTTLYLKGEDQPLQNPRELEDLIIQYSHAKEKKLNEYKIIENSAYLILPLSPLLPKDVQVEILYQGKILKELSFKSHFQVFKDKMDFGKANNYIISPENGYDIKVGVDKSTATKDPFTAGIITSIELNYTYPHPKIPHPRACDVDVKNPASPPFESYREYTFHMPQHQAQQTRLYLRDNTSDFDTRNAQSTIYLFPRVILPHYKIKDDKIDFTLPTGEKMTFLNKEKVFKMSSVFEEQPIDYGGQDPTNCAHHNRLFKKFPGFIYKGKGLAVRFNQYPGNFMPEEPAGDTGSVIKGPHGLTGTKGALVYYYDDSENKYHECLIPKKSDLVTTNGGRWIFTTDEEFSLFLDQQCGQHFGDRIRNFNLEENN